MIVADQRGQNSASGPSSGKAHCEAAGVVCNDAQWTNWPREEDARLSVPSCGGGQKERASGYGMKHVVCRRFARGLESRKKKYVPVNGDGTKRTCT